MDTKNAATAGPSANANSSGDGHGVRLGCIDDNTDIVSVGNNDGANPKRRFMARVEFDGPPARASSLVKAGKMQVDPGTYIVYDSAMGSTPVGAVNFDLNGTEIREWALIVESADFPFRPSTTNGTVRFRKVAAAQANGAAFDAWLTQNAGTYNLNLTNAAKAYMTYTPDPNSWP